MDVATMSVQELRSFVQEESARGQKAILLRQVQGAVPIVGTGSPEGAVVASVGRLFSRLDGGAGTTLYVKESGDGDTGWVAK